MYTVHCLNLITGKAFDKEFEFKDDMFKFIHKCSYSKKIKVIGYTNPY